MEPVDYSAFNGKFWQSLHTALIMAERAGIKELPYFKQSIADHIHRLSSENRRFKNKDVEVPSKPKATKQEVTIKQSNIPCPECQKGYLQVKKLDDVTYTACPQCYKSVEFK